jgi:hypothetical protein
MTSDTSLWRLIELAAGLDTATSTFATLKLEPALLVERGDEVSRAIFAMALNAILFEELLTRVPTAAAYVRDRRRARETIEFDHGALRTVHLGTGMTGAIPSGASAFSRILEPLGYQEVGTYPLEKLRMTGFGFAQQEFPETLPQFFVSELHVDRFSGRFRETAGRVFGTTREPLTDTSRRVLVKFAKQQRCELALAVPALREIAAAFGRWHSPELRLADYQALLAESAEAAWIATEGSAFNHATDRVPEVQATAAAQRTLGRAMKERVEISRDGSVRQTAFKADPVRRQFRASDGSVVEMNVPGSFYEFISRDPIDRGDGRRSLDLRFDSGNAQGIFRMTATSG